MFTTARGQSRTWQSIQQEHDRAKRDAREDGAEDEAREQRDRGAAEGADGHAEEELPHDDGGAYMTPACEMSHSQVQGELKQRGPGGGCGAVSLSIDSSRLLLVLLYCCYCCYYCGRRR